MGIRISERSDLFHVPYGSVNSEGTPNNNFLDLRATPEWIPVLPSCVGWPETQKLLQILNSPASALMSLAADQVYVDPEQSERQATLTSFVTICRAEVPINTKLVLTEFAEFLKQRIDQGLQEISNAIQRSLHVDSLLELQPTLFHHYKFEGWSLTVLMVVFESDKTQARRTWQLCMTILGEACEG